MRCCECTFFDNGRCRNPRSSKTLVGYFQEACGLFETTDNSTTKPSTMKENNENTAEAVQVCKGCGRQLPLEEFQKSRWGYTHYCKECFKKKQQAGSAKPAGTKSPAEKLEEMYRKEEKPEPPIRRTEFAHVATGAVHLESDEIVELMTCLALELRERGYEVTGTICHKIEI